MACILLVAGETSGDLHGSNLARALLRKCPDLRLLGAGGEQMGRAGVDLVHDSTRHATVGIVEAFRNLNAYGRLYRRLVSTVHSVRPDAVVLIDLPDFNIRFARHVRDCGIPIVYYISPQVWAWRKGRIRTLARIVDRMLVLFEFEVDLYRKAGVDVRFVGHPLLDVLQEASPDRGLRAELGVGEGERLLGLLPASRIEQFHRHFPLLIEAAHRIRGWLPRTRFVLACAPNIDPGLARARARDLGFPDLAVVHRRTYDAMSASDLLLMTSGTSTLEAAILGTPMIVLWRTSALNAFVIRRFLQTRHIALVNILAGREIVPEFVQERARPELIASAALRLLEEGGLESLKRTLARVRKKLGPPGASERAAGEILDVLNRRRGARV